MKLSSIIQKKKKRHFKIRKMQLNYLKLNIIIKIEKKKYKKSMKMYKTTFKNLRILLEHLRKRSQLSYRSLNYLYGHQIAGIATWAMFKTKLIPNVINIWQIFKFIKWVALAIKWLVQPRRIFKLSLTYLIWYIYIWQIFKVIK